MPTTRAKSTPPPELSADDYGRVDTGDEIHLADEPGVPSGGPWVVMGFGRHPARGLTHVDVAAASDPPRTEPRRVLSPRITKLVKVYDRQRAPAAAPASNGHHPTSEAAGVLTIPVGAVAPSPYQPRSEAGFDEADLRQLGESIKRDGLLEPIVVRPRHTLLEDEQQWELIAGERRLRASKLVGLPTIEARVRDVDDATAARLTLIENLQRRQLNAVDVAEGYRRLADVARMSQADIAKAVGTSQGRVSSALALLELPDPVLQLIREGQLEAGHGEALLRYRAFPEACAHIAKAAASAKSSVQQLRDARKATEGLEQANLGRRIHEWEEPFKSTCPTCPFGARFATTDRYGSPGHICLKPDHHDELKAKKAAQEKAVAAARAAATRAGEEEKESAKKAGKPLPKLYEVGDAIELSGRRAPPGCSAECACRGRALNWSGLPVDACFDAERYRGLERAYNERFAAAKNRRLAGQLERLRDRIDNLDVGVTVGAAELVLLVATAMRGGAFHENVNAALAYRELPVLPPKAFQGWGPPDPAIEALLETAARGDGSQLVQVAEAVAEGLVMHEIASALGASETKRGWLTALYERVNESNFAFDLTPIDVGAEPVADPSEEEEPS